MKASELRRIIKEEVRKVLHEENSVMSYPLSSESEAEQMLSGRSRGSGRARKMVSGLVDVFGDDVSILSGDTVIEYLQVNSSDGSLIYKVVRKDLQKTRNFYIPSKFRNTDQYDKIQSAL